MQRKKTRCGIGSTQIAFRWNVRIFNDVRLFVCENTTKLFSGCQHTHGTHEDDAYIPYRYIPRLLCTEYDVDKSFWLIVSNKCLQLRLHVIVIRVRFFAGKTNTYSFAPICVCATIDTSNRCFLFVCVIDRVMDMPNTHQSINLHM